MRFDISSKYDITIDSYIIYVTYIDQDTYYVVGHDDLTKDKVRQTLIDAINRSFDLILNDE